MSDDDSLKCDKTGESTDAETQGQSQTLLANYRLDQLSSHLTLDNINQTPPNTASRPSSPSAERRKRNPRSQIEALPPDHSDILYHIKTLKGIASTPDPANRGYIRQKTAGKLWVREGINPLLNANSFQEIGSLSGTATWKVNRATNTEKPEKFIPSNNPQGLGTMTCARTGKRRRIVLTADDFSIRSGHADGSNMEKTLYVEKLALKLRLPVVKLVDGSSSGGSVNTIQKMGYSYIPHNFVLKTVMEQLNADIPNLSAVVWPAIGLGAARAVCTHFSVMAEDVGTLFNAGRKVVRWPPSRKA
jgi:acetyl-CoA carboxylase carboxyltransferase component